MKRRFIVLRDTPEVKKGAILEQNPSNEDHFVVIEGTPKVEGYDPVERQVYYDRLVVENQPGWFREMKVLYVPVDQYDKVQKLLKIK